jgi:rubrerythrin
MRCFKCHEVHVENVKNFMIGNVIFCPHCNKSMVVRDNLNYHLRALLKDSYEDWERQQNEFANQRERERAEFIERRAKEAQAFETHQKRELEKIRQQLNAIGENYDAAGKPFKKGSRFGWG